MRQKQLIQDGSPCDVDFTDKLIQTTLDAIEKGRVLCSNHATCEKRNVREKICCVRQFAQQFAVYILNNRNSFSRAVREELHDLMNELPEVKYWVFRDEQWQVVDLGDDVLSDIVRFALVMVDYKGDDRRSFTKDGRKSPEMGPSDAMDNAMLDLDDIYGEVGQTNPFRV